MNGLCLNYRKMQKVALGYLGLPLLLFLIFFLKWYIGIPAAVVLVICYFKAAAVWKGKGERSDASDASEAGITIAWSTLAAMMGIALLWGYLGGQSGFFYQTSDWNERNAIFRDLITRIWPVYYEQTDTVLTYYIGHWLPAATVGRAMVKFGVNLDWAWTISNILLSIWTAMGVLTAWGLLLLLTGADTRRKQLLSILVFAGFSGLDYLGIAWMDWCGKDVQEVKHIEWWLLDCQFSSFTTQLFWVFNQAIAAWVATLALLNEWKAKQGTRNYVYLICCAFICAPIPCVGLGVLMISSAISGLWSALKKGKLLPFLRMTFNLSNVGMFLLVFPIVASYFLSNSALETTVASEKASVSNFLEFWNMSGAAIKYSLVLLAVLLLCRLRDVKIWVLWGISSCFVILFAIRSGGLPGFYVLFLLLEFGLYALLIYPRYKNDLIFYVIVVWLALCPLIHVGIGADFCMRASVPALVVLCAYCLHFLQMEKRMSLRTILLVACLCIAAVTPAIEIWRGIYSCVQEGTLFLAADEIKTLNQYHSSGGIYGNFVSASYENSFFFKYLAQNFK